MGMPPAVTPRRANRLIARIVAISVLLSPFLLVTYTPSASAYSFTGCRSGRFAGSMNELYWKGNGITPYYSGVIDTAAGRWNAQDIPGDFQSVGSSGTVIIERYSYTQGWYALTSWNCNSGYYSGPVGVALNSRTMDGLAYWQDKFVLIHELGHIEGLGHTDAGCGVSIMRGDALTGDPGCASADPPWYDDVNGARALYS